MKSECIIVNWIISCLVRYEKWNLLTIFTSIDKNFVWQVYLFRFIKKIGNVECKKTSKIIFYQNWCLFAHCGWSICQIVLWEILYFITFNCDKITFSRNFFKFNKFRYRWGLYTAFFPWKGVLEPTVCEAFIIFVIFFKEYIV